MFNFIKDTLKKVYSHVSSKLHGLFSRTTIDAETLKELETILISADTGIKTTKQILETVQQKVQSGSLQTGADLKITLEEELLALLAHKKADLNGTVFLLVGINGSGKTTFAGKLAYAQHSKGKRVMLVAADTFRAAAPEQLAVWAQRTGSTLITGKENQEPASVVFAGCEAFKKNQSDILIIDTAGRLQTKINLMKELEKIKKIVERHIPHQEIRTLLTIDAMLGQNSLEQARLFNDSTKLDGIVLTKMDGTGKGGIVFSITQELKIPIAYISFGEDLHDLKEFNAQEFVHDLLK